MFDPRLVACLLVLSCPVAPALAQGAPPTLTVVDAKGETHRFEAAALLADPDVETIRVDEDAAYKDKAPPYRALPLASFLGRLSPGDADILEATALDGYVAQLPADKVMGTDPAGAIAWLAVEDPSDPWPEIEGKGVSAGPYYVIWQNPERSGIRPGAWPYQIARLELKESVARRYPAIVVADSLPEEHPARRGQELFVESCFACHTMNGAGEAAIGPDLNLPMNPTEYFRAEILPLFIRDPSSVRHWKDQGMPGFPAEVLSDDDLTAIVAYLGHMADRKPPR